MRFVLPLVIALAASQPVFAQEPPSDTLGGFANPVASVQSGVSLRDYLSSRIDQLRMDMLDRIELVERQQRQLLDERDRQYAQRFEAQQKALSDALQATKESAANALQAIKETTSNTLAAAKEAVLKAEDANNKRFDSVNEFRQTLSEQATNFVSKDTFNARITALEEKVTNLTGRGQGADALWGYIVGVIGLFIVLAAFAWNVLHVKGIKS